jgi:protein traX
MKTDWLIFGPLFTLSIYMNKENKDRQAICYAAISVLSFSLSAFMCVSHGLPWYGQVWQIGTLLVIPIIYAYNGERGSKASFNKWFFYIFYPAHLVVLGLMRW